MSEKMIKLQFRPSKSHRTHNDVWNVFIEDGQVGEYPADVAKQKLVDFPLNFTEYKQEAQPKKVAKPQPKIEKPAEKKVEDEPDKGLKESKTKTKE